MFFSESIGFLLLFGVIIVSGYFFVNRFELTGLKRFQLIISYLGGLSALLITYNIYLNIRSNNAIEKNKIAYNTVSNIQNEYLKPQKELADAFPEGFFLYTSMNQDMDFSALEPKHFDESKRAVVELYGSLRMYAAIENFLTTARYDLSGMPAWINNFLTWLQSPILQKNWPLLEFNFSEDTRDFMKRLIQKANTLVVLRKEKGHLTKEDYDAISHAFPVTPR